MLIFPQACRKNPPATYAVLALWGTHMAGLVAGVILLDMGAQAATISNQTQIDRFHPEAQSRINTIYKMLYFGGGGLGRDRPARCTVTDVIAAWNLNSHGPMKLLSRCAWTGVFLLALTCRAQSPVSTIGPHPEIPPPQPETSVSKYPTVLGWPKGAKPKAPAGFNVELYASGLPNPRWIYVLPNGDVLVSEATGWGEGRSADRIELFRGLTPEGRPRSRTVFLKGLNKPFGMLLLKGWFYVANTDSIVRYKYRDGMTRIDSKGEKILDLPSSGYHGHWTRNIIANPEGTKIYVAVGSASNVAENGMEAEKRRADILEINPDGSGERIFASGLRNPIGFVFRPGSRELWAAVNERDRLGDFVPPDYLTHVQDGGFYGWPYSYWGQHEEPELRGQRPDLVKKAIVPDFALGCHTASLSVEFYGGKSFPRKYQGGAFVGQHGSWNSKLMQGYDVYFIPFEQGKPKGTGEPFLTGFIADAGKYEVYGRPVDVKALPDGSLLVTDDAGERIWRITA